MDLFNVAFHRDFFDLWSLAFCVAIHGVQRHLILAWKAVE